MRFLCFFSKLLLPLWRHATLTLKKSADLLLFYAFVSVPSPVFYGRLLEYDAEEASLPNERQGWGSIFSETIMLLCPSFPLYPSFVFCIAHYSFLPSCWTSLSIFFFVMSCFTSPGKMECWSESMFLQMVYFDRLVMELSLSLFPALEALFSSLWCTQPYVPLSFSGSDVLMGGRVWKVSLHCAKKLQCVKILRGLSPKLPFNRHTLESENMKSVLGPIYIWNTELSDNKAFHTEIPSLLETVQESLAGRARVVDWFFSSCCWEAKNHSFVCSGDTVQSHKNAGGESSNVHTEHAPVVAPWGFCQPSWLMVAPGRDDRVEELVLICLVNN